MGFDTQDLLRQAEYTDGDDTWGTTTQTHFQAFITTSSSYSVVNTADFNPIIRWDDIAPGSTQGRVVMWARVDPKTDQIDVKLRNQDDQEDVIEQTGITSSGPRTLGPQDYTPASTTEALRYNIQIRNGDGSTSVSLKVAGVAFGVQL